MKKIIDVEICNASFPVRGTYATIKLPASDYELLDAMDKVQVADIDEVGAEIIEYLDYEYIADHLEETPHLGELNALARVLANMVERDRCAFEGMFRIHTQQGGDTISVRQLINIAHSTDCCHIVSEAHNVTELGQFYVENGFLTETDGASDELLALLNYEAIGRKMSCGEQGAFTDSGYVLQHTELAKVADDMDYVPHKPNYLFRIGVENATPEGCGQKVSFLELPVSATEIIILPKQMGMDDWTGVTISSFDGVVPQIADAVLLADDIPKLNDLANRIEEIISEGKLTKYKAVLAATECHDIEEATSIADCLDKYTIIPEVRTPDELGQRKIMAQFDTEEAQIILRHIDLFRYGLDILENYHTKLTDYGLVEREDEQLICSKATLAKQQETGELAGKNEMLRLAQEHGQTEMSTSSPAEEPDEPILSM